MIIVIPLFLILLLLGIAAVAAMMVSAAVAFGILESDVPLVVVGQTIVGRVDTYVLLAIPLFLLMGNLMNACGLSDRLFAFAGALVGHMRGGLGQVNVVSATLLAGLSGSNIADASLNTRVLVPPMKREGWPAATAVALSSSTATLAVLIPPSIIMIVYGSVADVSVGDLFAAGVIPGLMLAVLFMITVRIMAVRQGVAVGDRQSLRAIVKSGRHAFWAILLPVLIVGGMRVGWFTPTEGAAVAVIYVAVIGMVVYRSLRIADLPHVLQQTVVQTGIIMLIVGAAAPISWLISAEGMPQKLAEATGNLPSQGLFLLATIVLLLLIGTFLEGTATVILVAPLLSPAAMAHGVDPVAFGVMLILAVGIGAVTPPFGQVVFATSAVSGISAESIFRANMPYLFTLVLMLFIVAFVPESFMWFVELTAG